MEYKSETLINLPPMKFKIYNNVYDIYKTTLKISTVWPGLIFMYMNVNVFHLRIQYITLFLQKLLTNFTHFTVC